MRKRAGSDRRRVPTNNPPPAPPQDQDDDEPAVPMPAVGARRSTRVFVPKASKPQPSEPARVLRSGKRLAFSDSAADDAHWLRWDTRKPKNGFHLEEDHYQHDKDRKPPQPLPLPPPPPARSFGIVYSRKRRRRHPTEPKDHTRFGIVFTRKDKRSRGAPFRRDTPNDLAAIPCSSSREFASRTGFLDAHFLTLVDDVATDAGAVLLVFLVDTSCSGSSHQFLRLLLPVLRWMRQSQLCKVRNLASFLSSAAVATVFASRGLHFVKLQRRRACALLLRTLVHCGWCELRGAKESQPLLSVNFSALPSYFQSLHTVIAFDSMYLPAVIRRSMRLVGGAEEMYPHEPLEADSGSPSTRVAEPAVDLGWNEPRRVVQDYVPLEQVAGVVVHGLRLKRHQRKRSSMRHPLNRQRIAARFPGKAIGMKQGTVATQTELKPPSIRQELSVEPVQPKPALEISLDLLENMDGSDVSTPMGSKELQIEGRERNSQGKMIPIPGVHEVSDDMEGIVTDPFLRPVPDYIRMVDDEVGRALSRDSIYDMDSEDEQWLIQLNHTDSDRKSSHLNHISYKDFEKTITTFEKDAYNNPEGTNDKDQLLSRYPALGKDDDVLAVYEYWINKRYKKGAPLLRIFQGAPLRRGQLSQKSSIKKKRSFKRQRSQAGRGKPETFMQVMLLIIHVHCCLGEEKRGEIVNKGDGCYMRGAIGKWGWVLHELKNWQQQDNAEEEALQRVVEAERAAKQAVETAVRLRSRAQSLMANAELATYKSVMALRIAEAARMSDSSRDLVSTTLD